MSLVSNLYFTAKFRICTSICAAAVCAAHSLGRIGCLFAGCCYGRVTDSVFSVYNAYLDARVVPVQLYESLFLAALFVYPDGSYGPTMPKLPPWVYNALLFPK